MTIRFRIASGVASFWVLLSALCPLLVSGQAYFLNGHAIAQGNDCYQLTNAVPSQVGTVWYADQINLNQPLDIEFLMMLGNLDANGADGMCFVLQTVGTSAIGISGGGMGYQGFGTSLGIEFDTWQNTDLNDPWFDHIAILKNGNISHQSALNLAGPVQMSATNPNTEDGQNHVVRITWDPATHLIRVYFDCVFRLSATVDMVNTIFNGQHMVYWGFTAATGGAYNVHRVCLQENIVSVGDEVQICQGASTVLTAGSSLNGIFTWSPPNYLSNASSPAPVASPPVTTLYTVNYTDLCGLPISRTVLVDVMPLEVELNEPPELNCLVSQSPLNASFNLDNVQFSWSLNGQPIVGSANTNPYTATQPGVYSVHASLAQVCTASASVEVTSNLEVPQISAGEGSIISCLQPEIILQGVASDPSMEFQWSTTSGHIVSGANGLFPVVSAPGTYMLTAINNQNGCSSSDEVVIAADIEPPLIAPLNNVTVCAGESVDLFAQVSETAQEILWTYTSGSIQTSSSQPAVTVLGAGMYQITATGTNGCQSTASATVTEVNPPDWFIPDPVYTICQGESLALGSQGANWTSIWQPGNINSPQLNVSAEGSYSLTHQSAYCQDTFLFEVIVTIPVDIDLGPDQSYCGSQNIVLNAGYPVNWNTGEVASSIMVNSTGTYGFIYGQDGCEISDVVTITFDEMPTVDLGEDRTVCEGELVQLHAGQSGLWNTGAVGPTLNVNISGNYSVSVINGLCTATDDVWIEFIPRVIVDLGPGVSLCGVESVELSAEHPQATSYIWSTGETTPEITVTTPGVYGVIVSSECGYVTDEVAITNLECSGSIYVPNAFTPDADGINDAWRPLHDGLTDYEVSVFDRWGSMVFYSTDPYEYWTGNIRGGEHYASNGVYSYLIRYGTTSNPRQFAQGHVVLIR